jgi:hypothetical protein
MILSEIKDKVLQSGMSTVMVDVLVNCCFPKAKGKSSQQQFEEWCSSNSFQFELYDAEDYHRSSRQFARIYQSKSKL